MKKLGMMIAIFSLVLLAACGQGEESGADGENQEGKKVLTMGTSADYPPFEYVETGKSDEIIGFDVDLAKAITEKLGYELKVIDIDFNSLIPAINADKADFVMAGMTPTPERDKNVDFSEIYYTANHMLISDKESKIDSVEDLEGKTVGVQLGSIQEGKAEELAEQVDIKIETRNRIPELIQEIKTGRFDGVIIEDIVAKGHIEKNPDLSGFTIPNTEEAGSAVAFENDSELVADFNKVIKEMKENGELEALIKKWFGGEQK